MLTLAAPVALALAQLWTDGHVPLLLQDSGFLWDPQAGLVLQPFQEGPEAPSQPRGSSWGDMSGTPPESWLWPNNNILIWS